MLLANTYNINQVINSIKQNWANILSISLAILGLLFGYYWYQQGLAERNPIFIVEPIRAEILSSKKIKTNALSVYYRSSSNQEIKIKSDLTAARFYFWNDGKLPIKAEEVLEPIKISLTDKTARILSSGILKESRLVTGIKLKKTSSNELSLTFKILEQGDGAAFQLIYEGDPKSNIVISGVIEGVGKIGNNRSLFGISVWQVVLKKIGPIIWGILGGVFSTMLMPPLRLYSPPRFKKIITRILKILCLVAVAFWLYNYIHSRSQAIRAEAETRISNLVPSDLR